MYRRKHNLTKYYTTSAVADPGFPRGGGANSPGRAPTYDFAKISQKLHEIERICTPWGGRASLAPPLRSATDLHFPISGGSRIFPRGGREPSRGGVNTPNFPENCMKSKEFGRPGGGVRPSRPPLDPPMPMFPQIETYQLFICVRSSGNCHVISFWGTLQDGGQNISFKELPK